MRPLLNYFTNFELIQGWVVFAFIVFMVLVWAAFTFYMNNLSEDIIQRIREGQK